MRQEALGVHAIRPGRIRSADLEVDPLGLGEPARPRGRASPRPKRWIASASAIRYALGQLQPGRRAGGAGPARRRGRRRPRPSRTRRTSGRPADRCRCASASSSAASAARARSAAVDVGGLDPGGQRERQQPGRRRAAGRARSPPRRPRRPAGRPRRPARRRARRAAGTGSPASRSARGEQPLEPSTTGWSTCAVRAGLPGRRLGPRGERGEQQVVAAGRPGGVQGPLPGDPAGAQRAGPHLRPQQPAEQVAAPVLGRRRPGSRVQRVAAPARSRSDRGVVGVAALGQLGGPDARTRTASSAVSAPAACA